MIAGLAPAARTVRSDLADWIRFRLAPRPVHVNEQERAYLRQLRQDGFVVIDRYWSRADAFALRDEVLPHLAGGADVEYPGGAYARFWDRRAHDEGVRRIYHVERLIPRLQAFRHDPLVLTLARAYYGLPFFSGVLVYQHNLQSNHNTRGYHVDWFGKEFKAFLYLDDVHEGNGPFTYLRGSHRLYLTRLRRQLNPRHGVSPTSFEDADLGRALEREVRVCGQAGTLILADVRGIHRGSPQIDGQRSALVNYLYSHQGDANLDR